MKLRTSSLCEHSDNVQSGSPIGSLLRRVLLVSVFLLAPLPCLAECPGTATVTPPSQVNMDPTLPVGSTLFSVQFSAPTTTALCPIGLGHSTAGYYGVGTPNGNLYPTGIPGMAYRVTVVGSGATTGVAPFWWGIFTTTNYSAWTLDYPVRFELVKTGPIMSGTFPAQDFLLGKTENNYIVWKLSTTRAIDIEPVTPACTASPVVTVNLDPAIKGSLATQGDTAGEKGFNINVTCLAPTSIALAFSGTVIDPVNAVFANTDATTGSSVGIQILKGSDPVPLGSGNFVQLGMVNGSISPGFSAKYYALNNAVVEGNVSSVVYATIVYN